MGILSLQYRAGRFDRMTRRARMLRSVRLNSLKSRAIMTWKTRPPGANSLDRRAMHCRMLRPSSMSRMARHTRLNRMNKSKLGRTITMESSAWWARIARLYRLC